MKNSVQTTREWFFLFQKYLYQNEQWAPLYPLFPLTLEEVIDDQKRLFTNERAIEYLYKNKNQALFNFLSLAFRGFIREVLKIPLSLPQNLEALHRLEKDGYTDIGFTDFELRQKIQNFLDELPLYAGNTQADLKPVTRQEANQYHMARYQTTDLIKSVDILYAATTGDFLTLAEAYLRHPVIVGNLSSWWSFPGQSQAINAQNFHLDIDDYRFCKGFIYMTDVDEDAGPHCYIPGTQNHDLMTNIIKSSEYTEEEFLQWYMQTLRKTDDECQKYLGIDPVNITGQAGSQIMVDTSGIHKGLLPKNKERLIVQFEYCASPNALIDVFQTPLSQLLEGREELRDHFMKPNIQYALQLLVDYDA